MTTEGTPITVTLKAGPYQALPDMPPEQFDALKADIAVRGALTPIDVDEQGTILDGHHRYRACCELGITEFPTIVRLGLDDAHKRAFARKSNALRRHLTRAQVRQLIADQLRDTPQWANNRIGWELGVDSKTVAGVRKRLEATSEIPKFDRLIGSDGKERPVTQARPPAVMAANLDELGRVLARAAELFGRHVRHDLAVDKLEVTGGWWESLRQNGIPLDEDASPFFYVNVNAVTSSTGPYGYGISVDLKQLSRAEQNQTIFGRGYVNVNAGAAVKGGAKSDHRGGGKLDHPAAGRSVCTAGAVAGRGVREPGQPWAGGLSCCVRGDSCRR